MGLSTAAVFTLLFVIGTAAAINLINAQDDYSITLSQVNKKVFDMSFNEVYTDIEISNVTYTGGDLMITVNNTGKVALDISHVYLMINGTWIPEDGYTLTPSSGYWEPTESITITYTASAGDWTVKVVAETGIEDRYLYRS